MSLNLRKKKNKNRKDTESGILLKLRKISANYVYSPHTGFIRNGILSLDPSGTVISLEDPGENLKEQANLEHYNGILVPGFVNSHCHIELSHMKGAIPEHIGLDNFIHHVITGREYDESEVLNAICEADREMQREGIVAVGDICNKEDSFDVKSHSRIYYHSFVEIFNLQKDQALDTFRRGMQLMETAREKFRLKASLVPHASYTVSENLFRLFRSELNNEDNLLSIHNQETVYEDEFISERKGNFLELFEKLGLEKGDSRPRKMNSLPWLSRVIPEKSPLLLVHNVHTTPEEIDNSQVDPNKTWFCLCPNSNLYIANILPGTFLMQIYPDRVCIGTDSLSSNHRLSILEEIKTLDLNYPQIGLASLFNFATLNGAKMLGIDHFAGSFEPGKKPGVNLIERVDLQGMRLRRKSSIRVLV